MRWAERVSTTHLYDGHNVHHLANYARDDGIAFGVVVAEQDGEHFLGLTLSASFGK